MRKILIAAALLVSASAEAKSIKEMTPWTNEWLLEICDSNSEGEALCGFYLEGVGEALAYAGEVCDRSKTGLTPQQMRAMYVSDMRNYIETNKGWGKFRSQPSFFGARMVLVMNWPCDEKSS